MALMAIALPNRTQSSRATAPSEARLRSAASPSTRSETRKGSRVARKAPSVAEHDGVEPAPPDSTDPRLSEQLDPLVDSIADGLLEICRVIDIGDSDEAGKE